MGKNVNKTGQDYCPFCHLVVAPFDRETLLTKRGKAHFSCAVENYLEILDADKATGVNEPWQFRNFLIDQAESLFRQKFSKKGEKKLSNILQIHEELYGQPLKISALVASV